MSQPINTEPKSACCDSFMHVERGIEGTSHYVCNACKEPCDPKPTHPDKDADYENRVADNCRLVANSGIPGGDGDDRVRGDCVVIGKGQQPLKITDPATVEQVAQILRPYV